MLGPKVRTEKDDFNQGTWMSLLDLLHPYEYFVPVDQTTLWRRHVAWAKPKGKEIRDYVTQRFSSNMVFLSLLLGTDMGIFMNSSAFTTEIREALMNEEYTSLKFYIGGVLALASCTTVMGLVATYTAWSMISALSDSNSNTLLRSSMGQYVTALPSRFVVASLYLFLLWLTLLLVELISGPLIWALLSAIAYMFFQVVVSLSAFGRLIIHTGAMGQKRVLDPEFERHLLPSGLHASLLIKATERSRRRTSVTDQYRQSSLASSKRHESSTSLASSNGLRKRRSPVSNTDSASRSAAPLSVPPSAGLPSPMGPLSKKRLSSEEHHAVMEAARAFGDFSEPDTTSSPPSSSLDYFAEASNGASRETRLDSASSETEVSFDELVSEIAFPRASVLNRTHSRELKKVVHTTLSSSAADVADLVEQANQELQRSEAQRAQHHGAATNGSPQHQQHTAVRRLAQQRQSMSLFRGTSNRSLLRQEWAAEDDVRQIYDIEPPAEIFNEEDEDDEDGDDSDFYHMPRISVLNRSNDFGALRKLVTSGMEDLGESFSRLASVPPSLDQIQESPEQSRVASYNSLAADDLMEEGKKVMVESSDDEEYNRGEKEYLLSKQRPVPK